MTAYISVSTVFGLLEKSIAPIGRLERLPLSDALGAVLAESIASPADVPAFTNSAMDGFAFRHADLPTDAQVRLSVEGVSYAGAPWTKPLSPGKALRVMTGGAVPEGADTVIPFEHVKETETPDGTVIEFPHDEVKPGANVRLKGEEIRAGQTVMPEGTLLTPAWLGMAASLGHADLLVRRVRVAVFSTGDELRAPGTPGPLPEGAIYNANSQLIASLVCSWGAVAEDLGILPDDPQAIEAALAAAAQRADFIVTSGGVGEGEHDYTTQVLARLGEVEHYHVSQRPGKPFSFGRIGQKNAWFMALPGNPVAAALSASLYLKRAVLLAAGVPAEETQPLTIPAQAAKKIKARTGRTDFVRGRLVREGEKLLFTPAASQSSAMLTTLAGMNAVAVLDENTAGLDAGAPLTCLAL